MSDALKVLTSSNDPNLIVSFDTADDAAVYRLTPEIALVSTVDFITPPVDDPYWFGQIAAANSLSDVYAMGGKPLTALNLIMVPSKILDKNILKEILRGGHDKVIEAGASMCGGHSVDDNEPKYGLAVTGVVHPEKILTNSGAQEGDALILTKPLGTGVLFNANKSKKLPYRELELILPYVASMGPYVGRKDGHLFRSLGDHRESMPGDFAKAEFLKDWTGAHTSAPADGWFGTDFDDSNWGRYQANELCEKTGGYGGGFEFANRVPHGDRFSLRTCFGISDPAAAQDLSLELAYRGGVVVYLNGKEAGRRQLPAGDPGAAAFADDYPAEAYVAEDGATFLPGVGSGATPEPKWKDRYEQRMRRLKLRSPPESLVKGSNVLAVEIRRAPMGRTGPYGLRWDHCGFTTLNLR